MRTCDPLITRVIIHIDNVPMTLPGLNGQLALAATYNLAIDFYCKKAMRQPSQDFGFKFIQRQP